MQRLKLTPIRGQSKPVPLGDMAVSIGRGPENSIPLIDEKASRQHCLIQRNSNGFWIVKDLASRNGTKVNDQKVNEHTLRAGDVLRVGSHEFLIETDRPLHDAVREGLSVDAALQGETLTVVKASLNNSAEVGWMFNLNDLIESVPPKGPGEAVRIIDANGVPSEVLEGLSDGPNALRLFVQLASKSRATDIHFEPKGDFCHVRMRIDGDMVPIIELTKRVGELVLGVIKAACHMHMAGRDAVQDGHFSSVFAERKVEYRVSFTPSLFGQKLVVRVLDQKTAPGSLNDLGMPNYMLERIRQIISQDSGLLLSVGPTGSGKTTTLYNALREIDRQTSNVVTIEDPVEYQLDNTTQIPIDEAKGNTFGTLLRSVLRQDPDVILVGEIRDEETARVAMQAALTGHMVFSSVHAKESIASIFRLLDLKVEPYLVANALNLVLAQRLVRVLCEHCKRDVPATPGQATRLGRFLGNKTRIYTATGCGRCLRTGFHGRRALFELLDVNDELRDIILHSPSITAMKKIIEQGLFTTLQQSGWKLVAEGVTSLEEIDKVAGVN